MEAYLTPDQLAFIRAAAARYRMDEAGPMMLEALKKAKQALGASVKPLRDMRYEITLEWVETALESVRAAIAAAE